MDKPIYTVIRSGYIVEDIDSAIQHLKIVCHKGLMTNLATALNHRIHDLKKHEDHTRAVHRAIKAIHWDF